GKVDDTMILDLIRRHFDFRPEAIIRSLDLRRPIYRPVAAYGHFGRTDIDLPWEKTDKAATLKKEAGL
ncbi:MAG: methionine adenosyltransferase domain-containing protein, partial [Chloroflexota bacterium]